MYQPDMTKKKIRFSQSVSLKKSRLTLILIGINVGAFLATSDNFISISEGALYYHYGYIPQNATAERAFTSMFMHSGWLHLLLNIYALILIGPAVEKHFGKAIFIAVYLGSGICGVFVHTLAYPTGNIPLVGASGAIVGLFGIAAVLGDGLSKEVIYSQVVLFIVATVLIGNGHQVPLLTNIAYMAHFGGFVFGYLMTRFGMQKQVKKYLKSMHRNGLNLSIYK